MREAIPPFPKYAFVALCLVKAQGQLYLFTFITRWEATQKVMAAKLTRMTDKIAIQQHLVAENCTICSFRSRRPVRKLLDTPSSSHH
jgi:hypothetical protein